MLYFFVFFSYIFRSKIKLNIISLSHTSNQVPQSKRRLIIKESCPRSRRGHTQICILTVTVNLSQVLPPSSEFAVLCLCIVLVCCDVPIGSTVSPPPPSMQGPPLPILGWEHQLVLPVDQHIWGLYSHCASTRFLNMFTVSLLTTL